LHLGIETRLVVTGRMIDLHHGDVDCGIRYGRGDWPGTRAELIGGTRYRPVISPEIAHRLTTPADLATVPVIRDTTTMLSWDAWLGAAGVPGVALNGPTYDDPALAFDAAISGQGVLLAVDEMSADAVSDGRLKRPFETVVESGVGYWFVVADGRREPPRVKAFREWLRTEWPDSVDGYVAQMQRRKAAGP
ncbi:LysR substrate-binding domain-containing protein, partial [Bosea sp. (in: a-proteobacteria)]|uniref:LysR substrate-binding domain-containing protein n=1 Tax=Bosea sp. (in: a-proteobacteria) TaxID=1871050 RepID=UPI0025C19BA3